MRIVREVYLSTVEHSTKRNYHLLSADSTASTPHKRIKSTIDSNKTVKEYGTIPDMN